MHPELIGGRYRVGTAIGRGGMGTVWLCRDEKLHRDVAVKQVGLLPGESVTDSARALREARSSAALSHRNVVTVFDVIEENGAVWLVMENVPSRSLADLVSQEGPLDPGRVADIGAQVADGLAAAHEAGTIHRDVKPGNVLVREDGVAKISDFGIARSAGDPALTQSGLLTGTPSYFSPELARGAAPSPASDVWALGATLYAAVEGRPAYRPHGNPVAVLHEIASSQPPAPRRAGFLEPVLLRMLDREPASRWSMADAAHALRRLADEHRAQHTTAQTRSWAPPAPAQASPGIPSVPAESPPSPPAEPARTPASNASAGTTGGGARGPVPSVLGGGHGVSSPSRRRGGYVGLAAAALLLVLAGVLYALTQRGPDGGGAGSDGPTARAAASSSTSPTPDSSGSPDAGGSSGSPDASASPDAGSSSGSPDADTSASPKGVSTGGLAAKAAFLRGYFQVAGTDAGWALLSEDRQRDVGRGSYDGFWGTIESATVSDVTDVGGSDEEETVEATVRYRFPDGRVVTERQRFDLVRSGGRYLIDDDDRVG